MRREGGTLEGRMLSERGKVIVRCLDLFLEYYYLIYFTFISYM